MRMGQNDAGHSANRMGGMRMLWSGLLVDFLLLQWRLFTFFAGAVLVHRLLRDEALRARSR